MGVKGQKFGCEDSITLSFMDSVRKVKPEAEFVSVSDRISKLRSIKDEDEIKAIRKSTKKARARLRETTQAAESRKKRVGGGL